MNRGITAWGGVLLFAVACGGTSAGAEPVVPEPAAAPSPPPKVKIVNRPGAAVTMAQVLEPGRVTVVEFYADWCGACKIIERKVMTAIGDEPRVVLRKINIDDDTSPVARQYDVGALPHVRIFDNKGKLAYVLVGNSATRAGPLAVELASRK